MLEYILFASIVSIAVSFMMFIDPSEENRDIDSSHYFKIFLLTFFISFVALYVFQTVYKSSPMCAKLNVDLLD